MGGGGGVKNEGSLGLELPAAEGSKCLHVQFIVSKMEVQAVQINVLNEVESVNLLTVHSLQMMLEYNIHVAGCVTTCTLTPTLP